LFRKHHIYFSPHLDDAVFSCGGSIDAQAALGDIVWVVTIFAGVPKRDLLSPFARKCHEQWLSGFTDVVQRRRQEDQDAVTSLNGRFQHWDYLECLYRASQSGDAYYQSYEDMYRMLPIEDIPLFEQITSHCERFVRDHGANGSTLYYPRAIGSHVDHQLTYRVGLRMARQGYRVLFYEDLPYAWKIKNWDRALFQVPPNDSWQARVLRVNIEAKIKGAKLYEGGDGFLRMREYGALRADGNGYAERFWEWEDTGIRRNAMEAPIAPQDPSIEKSLLSSGSGKCLDLCDLDEINRKDIEALGYKWIGTGLLRGQRTLTTSGNGVRLPFKDGEFALILMGRTLDKHALGESIVREVTRILSKDGLLLGALSVTPGGASTYWMDPSKLTSILQRNDFKDISFSPKVFFYFNLFWDRLKWKKDWAPWVGPMFRWFTRRGRRHTSGPLKVHRTLFFKAQKACPLPS
jgi:LmbE family N-acetylglucosaminyl deacetylase